MVEKQDRLIIALRILQGREHACTIRGETCEKRGVVNNSLSCLRKIVTSLKLKRLCEGLEEKYIDPLSLFLSSYQEGCCTVDHL